MAKESGGMDDDSCSKFIGSLTKYLQSLCHSYVDFATDVELVGHIYLHVDRGKKIDYVLNESVCKNGSNVVKFTSNSYHAQPIGGGGGKDKKDASKKGSDSSRPGEEGRKRDDNDVIIVGSEAAKRRRAMSIGSASQSQGSSNSSQSGGMSGSSGGTLSSSLSSSSGAGMFRHPRGPNPRMTSPMLPPGARPGPFHYQARRRMPPPPPGQQPRGYPPMASSAYAPRGVGMRQQQPPYHQPAGVQPIGGRGTFPVPSDVASIRGQGQLGMRGKPVDPRYQHPYPHLSPRGPLPMPHPQGPPVPPGGAQPPPHLLTSMGQQLPTRLGLPANMGAPMMPASSPSSSCLAPHHRFIPPYPLSAAPQRAPSMSLPVTTQLTASLSSHPTSTSRPTVPASTVAPVPAVAPRSSSSAHHPASSTSNAASASVPASSAAAPATVMIKGRPVPIPASLTSTTGQQNKTPGPESSSSSSAGRPSSVSQSSATSGSSSSSSSSSLARSQQVIKTAKSSSACAVADSLAMAMSLAGMSTAPSALTAGVSPKGRPSTPALEPCAARKELPSPSQGGAFPFPPTSSGSSSGGVGGTPFVPGVHSSPGTSSLKSSSSSSVPVDRSPSKNALSPRAGGSSGYFRYPGNESGQPGGGASNAHPLSSLNISIPPFPSPGSGSQGSGGSSYHSPRFRDRSHSYSGPGGMDLSQANSSLGGSGLISPRGSDRGQPFQNMGAGGQPYLPASGSNLHSPRAGDLSNPYVGGSVSHSSFSGANQLSPHEAQPFMGSNSVTESIFSASNQLSPRGAQPYMGGNSSSYLPYSGANQLSPRSAQPFMSGSDVSHSPFPGNSQLSPRGSQPFMSGSSSGMSISHSVTSANILHSPRAGNGSIPYNMGSSSASASDSNMYSPQASFGDPPYMGSSGASHTGSNLHSPRAGDRHHPYMGSSNVQHPSAAESHSRSPRGGEQSCPSYGDVDSGNSMTHLSASAGDVASRAIERTQPNGPSSENSDRNMFSSLAVSSFPPLTPNDSFPPTNHGSFSLTSLNDRDLHYPPAAGSGNVNSPYPPVQNGRLPYPPSHSGSSLPYPTFGDLPFTSLSSDASCAPLTDLPVDGVVNSQLNSDRLRHSENVFDMFGQQAQTDSMDARFSPGGPPQTDTVQSRFGETDPLSSRSQASELPSPSTFPLNLSHHTAPFPMDQGPTGVGDGYSELVSELQALTQPTLNQLPPISPAPPCLPGQGEHQGMPPVPPAPLAESDAQRQHSAQPKTSGAGDEGVEDPAPQAFPLCESGTEESEERCEDGVSPERTATACQTTTPQTATTTGDVAQTFLMPYEISGHGVGGGGCPGGTGGGGGEQFHKRSGSVSSHSHETSSPSPGSVAGTEAAVTEPKPQGQQASDYDSGCDSGSTSTGDRVASPQGNPHAQSASSSSSSSTSSSSSSHLQLKSLTIPLVPVDSPKSLSKNFVQQERSSSRSPSRPASRPGSRSASTSRPASRDGRGEGTGEMAETQDKQKQQLQQQQEEQEQEHQRQQQQQEKQGQHTQLKQRPQQQQEQEQETPLVPAEPELGKDVVDPEWAAEITALNHSDTESYSEGDDPDYVPRTPRTAKAQTGPVKRTRSRKTERVSRGKKRKIEQEEKGAEKEVHKKEVHKRERQNSGKKTAPAEENGPTELPPLNEKESSAQPEPEGEKGDRYDPGVFLLLDTPNEPDRSGRAKSSHTPAEVISTPEGEAGLWVHTLVPAGHGLWRLPPEDHKCQSKVDNPEHVLRTLYKVTVKIVAGKVLYKFDDM